MACRCRTRHVGTTAKLWVLESAKGTVATIDPATGRCETVAELPGLRAAWHFAEISPSSVCRRCGKVSLTAFPSANVYGLKSDVAASGSSILAPAPLSGSVKFEEAVQEVLDIQLLPGIRYPDILEPDADLIGASFVLSGRGAGRRRAAGGKASSFAARGSRARPSPRGSAAKANATRLAQIGKWNPSIVTTHPLDHTDELQHRDDDEHDDRDCRERLH